MSPGPGWLAGVGARNGSPLSTAPAPTVRADEWGADGSGGTDSTAAINSAIAALSELGGGVLTFSPGTYLASQITLKSNVILDGGSATAVVLKQLSGSNVDFIISDNFAALTGTSGSSLVVPGWFGLRDITIDGNKTNNSAGRGIAWCGNGLRMLGVVAAQNCVGDNIYTECPSDYLVGSPPVVPDFAEGYFEKVISIFPGDVGWRFRGPTDSTIQDYMCVLDNDSSYGWLNENTATASGVVDWFGLMHVWPYGAGTARLGFSINSTMKGDTLMADGVSCVIASMSVVRYVDLLLIGQTAFDGLTVSANGTSIGTVKGYFSSAATNSIAINWTGSEGAIGRAHISGAGASTGNTALKCTGGSNIFTNLYVIDLSTTGSVGINEGGAGANVFHGTVVNCKTGWTYAASAGFVRADLNVFTNTGQVAVAGSTPGATDRLTIRELGVQSAGTDARVVSVNAIAMDSTALQTVTLAHTCLYTPTARNVSLTFSTPTVTDFVWAIPPYFVSADGTNLTIKCKLSTASATGGSKGDVIAHVRMGA